MQRETQAVVCVDHLIAYVFRIPSKVGKFYFEEGAKLSADVSAEQIGDAMLKFPVYWAFLIFFLTIMSVSLLIIPPVFYRFVRQSFMVQTKEMYEAQEHTRSEYAVEEVDCRCCKRSVKCYQYQQVMCRPKHAFNNAITVVQAVGFVLTLVLFIAFQAKPNMNDVFDRIVPSTWSLFQSSYKLRLPKQDYLEEVRRYREEMKGTGWYFIDDREEPVYPLVKGTREQYCSYNPGKCANSTNTPAQEKSTDGPPVAPNIFFFVIESFSPSPKFFNNEFLTSKAQQNTLYDGAPFDESYAPALQYLAKKGTTFSGISAHGLPTIFGWLGLFTTEKPKLRGLNMISSRNNHEESFAHQITNDLGYHSSYVAPNKFEFDGSNYWVFNRGWFDEVHCYVPNDEQTEVLGLGKIRRSSWIADRITLRQTMYSIAKQFVHVNVTRKDDIIQKFLNITRPTGWNQSDLDLVKAYMDKDLEKSSNISK